MGDNPRQSNVQFAKPSSDARRPWQPSSGFPNLVRLQWASSFKSSTISTSQTSCAFGRYGTPVFLSKTIHSAGPQVHKHFERISRHSTVWRWLLRRLKLPLPHLPCPISVLSAAQTELVIRRAISVDRHWAPRPRARDVALDSDDKPYIIKFAPGGRYLAAATRNVRDSTFGVVIWDLETPHTPTQLVRYQTRTLLSSLFVKWMIWEKEQGLALVMLRLLDGTKKIKKTEVHVVHISLENLHRLSADMTLGAPPFKQIQTHKNRCQIAQVSLEDHVLLLTHRPRTLVFVNLLTRDTCQIKLRNAIPDYVRVPTYILG
jgi:hypothetical protein